MGIIIKASETDTLTIETTDNYTGEGLDDLSFELDTIYGHSLIYLNEEKLKELRDFLNEWCDG